MLHHPDGDTGALHRMIGGAPHHLAGDFKTRRLLRTTRAPARRRTARCHAAIIVDRRFLDNLLTLPFDEFHGQISFLARLQSYALAGIIAQNFRIRVLQSIEA